MTSIFDKGAPVPCPAPFNLAQYVLSLAPALGDKCALSVLHTDHTDDWTYARFEAAVRGTATGLLQQGLKPGDRILMRLGNTVEFPILFLAAITAGLVPVPTSSQLTTLEITAISDEIAPALIVADNGIPLPDPLSCPVISAQDLHSFHHLPPAFYAEGDPNRLAYIIYTSGTSGIPRAVRHAHRAIWARRMMFKGWYGLTAHDRMIHAGAFNWTYTLGTGLMDPLSIGATALIPAAGTSAADLPALIARHRATIFAAAPGVYRQMLKNPLPPLPDLRHGLSAGEKLPETIRTRWNGATGKMLFEAYGMSECSTFISGSPDHPAPHGASGYPQQGRRVAVLDQDGKPVPFDTAGTLAVHRDDPGLMLGYLGAETETNARFIGDWFLTGDSCSMAPDGAITYLGRTDDMMNAGGYRVSPLEVEHALATHPAIHEVAAVEVTVKADTTVIAAFYTSDTPLDETGLIDYAKDRLARYKTPRIYVRVASLPKGANGKLLRRQLRETYEKQT
ncbi:class I adenylate-forming enzyme family protein [Profundibacter sp.]